MTEQQADYKVLLPALPTREEKEGWLFIMVADPDGARLIEKTYNDHGLRMARLHIAAWYTARTATPPSLNQSSHSEETQSPWPSPEAQP